MAKIPVSKVYEYLEEMLSDKWGYIYGTAGKLWTEQAQKSATNDMAIKYGKKWIGHMVTDCSGVMVYIWNQFGMSIEHGSNAIARKRVGEFVKTPKAGYAAFKWREKGEPSSYKDGKGDYYHIGIVGSDGETVYESKGTQAGFVTSKASTWYCFAPFKDVDYEEKEQVKPMEPYYAKVTGDNVRIRSGPGVNFTKLGAAYKGDIVRVITENGNWSYILPYEADPKNEDKSKIVSGYMFAQYLEPVEIEETIVEPIDQTSDQILVAIPADLAFELYKALQDVFVED